MYIYLQYYRQSNTCIHYQDINRANLKKQNERDLLQTMFHALPQSYTVIFDLEFS